MIEIVSITNYDPETGAILGSITGDSLSVTANKTAHCVYGEYKSDTHYINNGVAKQRPNQSTVLQGSTLRNLPIPCQIYINGTMYECDDGVAELSFNQPTSYHIKVVSFPFLDWEVTIENQT